MDTNRVWCIANLHFFNFEQYFLELLNKKTMVWRRKFCEFNAISFTSYASESIMILSCVRPIRELKYWTGKIHMPESEDGSHGSENRWTTREHVLQHSCLELHRPLVGPWRWGKGWNLDKADVSRRYQPCCAYDTDTEMSEKGHVFCRCAGPYNITEVLVVPNHTPWDFM